METGYSPLKAEERDRIIEEQEQRIISVVYL
jgi:ribosome maturation protein Sdo1